MDLMGPMQVKSIGGKMFTILVNVLFEVATKIFVVVCVIGLSKLIRWCDLSVLMSLYSSIVYSWVCVVLNVC